MYQKQEPRARGQAGHVKDVRFIEVEFEAPRGTRMVIELSGGLRLIVADDSAVELAADLINFLRRPGQGGGAR
jgi:hypothetical protein